MSKNTYSTIDLSTKQIKDLYNIYKQVKAKDLPQLAKTYKDNPKILVVLMKLKNKRPTITLNDLMKEIKSIKEDVKSVKEELYLFKHEIKSDIAKIKQQQTKDHDLLLRIIKLNNLRTS